MLKRKENRAERRNAVKKSHKKRNIVISLVAVVILTNMLNGEEKTEETASKTVNPKPTEIYEDGKPDASRGFFYGTLVSEEIVDNKATVKIKEAGMQSVLTSHLLNIDSLIETCFYDTLDEINYYVIDETGTETMLITVKKDEIEKIASDTDYRDLFTAGKTDLNTTNLK